MTLILRGDVPITTPRPDTPTIRTVYVSDSFSGGDMPNVIGRSVDGAMGGEIVSWQGTNDASGRTLAIANGRLTRPGVASASDSWGCGVPVASADLEVSFTLVTPAAGNSIWVDIRRATAGVSGSPAYRLQMISGSNTMRVQKRNPSQSNLSPSTYPVAAGDRVAFGAVGSRIYVLRNDAVVWVGDDPDVTAPGFVSFAGVGATATFEVDDLLIRAPITP